MNIQNLNSSDRCISFRSSSGPSRGLFAAIALSIVLIVLSSSAAEAKQIQGDAKIDPGSFKGWRMDIAIPSTIEYNITCTNGTRVDVFVLDEANYSRYAMNQSFEYYLQYSFLNVTEASANMTVLSGAVYVVVDNSGMPSIGSAANSSSQADIQYWIGTSFALSSAPDFGSVSLMAVFGILLVIALVAVVYAYRRAIRESGNRKKDRRGRSPPPDDPAP